MRKYFRIIAFAVLGVAMSGCVSMSTIQTARTTDPGDFVYGSAVGYATGEDELIDTTRAFAYPMFDISTRFGITNRLDIGARWTFPTSFMFDGKYMLYGDNSESLFALSTGAGVGFVALPESNNYEQKMLNIMIPLYASIHPTDWLGLYASPKYNLERKRTTDVQNAITEIDIVHYYGSTLGIKLGKDSWKNSLFFEVSYFGNSNGNSFSQVLFGVGYGIK